MNKQAETLTRKKKNLVKHTPDILLIAMILLIVGFGVVMVYSASNYYAMTTFGNPLHFAKKQGMIGLAGIVGMFFVAYKFNYRIFSNMKISAIIYSVSLLLALSLFFIGVENKGATRWLNIGGISFQPSELVKIAVILMLSSYIVKYRNKLDNLLYVALGGIIVLVPAALIAAENLSSAIVVAFVGFLILFISTPRIWYYVMGIILVGVVGFYMYYLAMSTAPTDDLGPISGIFMKQYRLDRFRVWKDPWLDPKGKGYQPIQSLYAVGSGGLFGQGLGQGIQKLGFLPEPHNDIIFAVICEELGLVGASLLLLAYAILVLRGLAVAANAQDFFGALVATGISGMIGIQVLINVAVNTNTIPTTGMQLPLVSYGGTALIILLGTLGILVNISRTSNIDKVG
ncbi:MAG: FtsW/RodA/SpoVE family cell cycle protein [Cellulosilyticaceae bacterium]